MPHNSGRSPLCLCLGYLFCLPCADCCALWKPQTDLWLDCLWMEPLLSHSVMKANASSGSSAPFVPGVLSHEFNPALSTNFHSFNLELPGVFAKVPPAHIRKSVPYLSRLSPGASSNDPLSFAGFLLFLIWQIPLR